MLKRTCEDEAKDKAKEAKCGRGQKKRTEALAQSYRRDLKLRGKWRPGEELLRSGTRIMGNSDLLSKTHHTLTYKVT